MGWVGLPMVTCHYSHDAARRESNVKRGDLELSIADTGDLSISLMAY